LDVFIPKWTNFTSESSKGKWIYFEGVSLRVLLKLLEQYGDMNPENPELQIGIIQRE